MAEKSYPTSITLSDEEIPYKFCLLPESSLRYYPDNPRIYTDIAAALGKAQQKEIEDVLQEREHVRKLASSIEANGGIINPLWVRDGDFFVVEGNQRLAAFRILSKRNPMKWDQIKCHLLPKNIDEDKIFSLLCQCHIVGTEEWAPYERAGILWRRNRDYHESPEKLSKEEGIGIGEINMLIGVYSLMEEHNDTNVQHWSHYLEYYKSRKIQRAKNIRPELESVVVKRIKAGKIKAEEIRDKLKVVANADVKSIDSFISKPESLDIIYDKVKAQAGDSSLIKTISRFRTTITDLDTINFMKNMKGKNRKECRFELKRINNAIKKILIDL